MIPFEKNYYIHKIEEYKKKIEEQKIGKYSIEKNVIDNLDGYLYKNLEEKQLEVIELKEEDKIWMRISPHEIQGSFEAIEWAHGKVGVVGLGLGYFVEEILKKDSVTEVIVYEVSKDIIELYKNNFRLNKKLKVINEDAFQSNKEYFDCFYVDIYQYQLTEQVANDYIHFNNIHNIEEYSFWGVEHFLLSCTIEDILMVYIPDNWVYMAKDLFNRFNASNKIKDFIRLNESKVKSVLDIFKKILNH